MSSHYIPRKIIARKKLHASFITIKKSVVFFLTNTSYKIFKYFQFLSNIYYFCFLVSIIFVINVFIKPAIYMNALIYCFSRGK